MKAALISMGSISSKWIAAAMKIYFDEVDDINIKDLEIDLCKKREILYNGEPLKQYDCVYLRGSFRYSAMLRSMTEILDLKTYTPISAEAFTIGHDKIFSQICIQKHGIPMPASYLAPNAETAKKIIEKMKYPIMMKLPTGTQGKGVMFADSYESASSMLDTLIVLKQPFLIQEYIETEGKDIRAIVVGEKVVVAMRRTADKHEKRANMHAGASGTPITLDKKTEKIAVQAAKAIGAEICAVDILESHKGPLVLEVNLSPGLQGITKTTNENIADKIAKYLFTKTKDIVTKNKNKGQKDILDNLGIESSGYAQEIITNLEMRGDRILLPESITVLSKLNTKEEIIIKVKEGYIQIEEQHQ